MLGWRFNMQAWHGLVYLLARALPAFAVLLTLSFYTRWVKPEDYGVYSTLLVVTNSAHMILFNWLYVALMRFWNEKTIEELELRRIVLLVLLFGSLLVLGFSVIYFLFTKNLFIALAIAGLMISYAIYTAYQQINYISLKAEQFLVVEIVRTIIATCLGLLFVKLGYSWHGIVLATVISFLCIPLVFKSFWTNLFHSLVGINSEHVIMLLKYGLPLSLTFILLEIIHVSDRILLTWFIGFDAAGQYAVAFSIPFQLITMLAGVVNMAFYPLILKELEEQGCEAINLSLTKYLTVLWGVLLPTGLGLLSVSQDILPFLIGKEYIQISLSLLPWIICLVTLNVLYLFHTALAYQLAKKTHETVKIVGVAAVVNILLNIILIPLLQIKGVIIASLIAYLICVIYGYWQGAKLFKLPKNYYDLIKISIAAFFMWLFLKLIPIEQGVFAGFIRIFLGLFLYGGFVWVFNILDIRAKLFNVLKNIGDKNGSINYQS